MKKNLIFLCIGFALLFNACNPDTGTIIIKINNNSNHSILVNYTISYPDTSLTQTYAVCEIPPYSSSDGYTDNKWESEFRSNTQGILQFFIHDVDTIKKYGSEVCRTEYKILKRYDLTLKDLEEMNWIITYP